MTQFLIKHFIKDNGIDEKKTRQKYGFLSGKVGIVANLMLFLGKLVAGILTASVSVMADALNNLSDAGSSIITIVGFKISTKPADSKHPFGHGRIEYVSAFIISMFILFMGYEVFKTSVKKIINPEDITFGIIPIVILVISVLVKLWLYYFNKKMSKTVNSTTLKATAIDSLSDSISTFAVLVGILIYKYTNVNTDGIIGVLVAIFIIISGVKTAKETVDKLLGEAPDKSFIKRITEQVLAYEEILGVHDLIVHNYGAGHCVVSLHAEVSCNCDFMEIHDLVDNIENEINEKYKCITVIHMDPIAIEDETVLECRDKIRKIIEEIDITLTMHDFRMVIGETHTNILFDVVVPYGFKISDEEIINFLTKKIKNIDEKYNPKIVIDKISIL